TTISMARSWYRNLRKSCHLVGNIILAFRFAVDAMRTDVTPYKPEHQQCSCGKQGAGESNHMQHGCAENCGGHEDAKVPPRLSHVTAPRGFSAAPTHARMQSSRLGGAPGRPPTAPRVAQMWVPVEPPSSLPRSTVARRIRLGGLPRASVPSLGGCRRCR